MDLSKALFKGDKVIWTVFFFLCGISLIEVYSASSMLTYGANARHFDPIIRHATFLLGGTVLVILIQNIHFKKFPQFGFYLLLLSIGLLLYAMLGGLVVNDAARWVSIMGIKFQPSEFAKLGVVITSANLLSRFQDSNNASPKAFRGVLMISGFICLLIFKENISTAILLFSVVFIMMFIGRVEIKKLFMVALTGIAAVALLVFVLKVVPPKTLDKLGNNRLTTMKSRIDNFFTSKKDKDKELDMTGKDMQVIMGKVAIANGVGFGLFPGNSETRDFLPQAFSDFIFAIIIEETGLIGGFFVPFLYFVLLFRVGIIANRCGTLLPTLIIIGCALIIVFQALINMSVAVNLIPVTGQPLPLISRGGTSTVITCIYFGIILSVSEHINQQDRQKLAEQTAKEEENREDEDAEPALED